MANYYSLISGLPDITVDQSSIPISSKDYIGILKDTLTNSDRKLLDIVLMESLVVDVANVIEQDIIEPRDEEILDSIDGYSSELINELNMICYKAKEETPLSKSQKTHILPSFIREFVYRYYSDGKKTSNGHLSVLDELSMRYYEFAQEYKSPFIRDWFTLNKNIRNILAAYTCKKLGWDINNYVLGTSEIEDAIRGSSTKDFGLSDSIDYIQDIIDIAEDSDIASRERRIDLLKWNWLDEYTFARVFDIDNVISYYIRLCIIERWVTLNEERGEQTFRNIVRGLKEASRESLQEFKDKQRK